MNEEKNITVSFGHVGRLHADKTKSTAVFIKLHTDFREEQLKELKGAPLSVFMCLALHMDENGETFVSNSTISKETGYGISSIKSAKKFLFDNGYLDVKEEQWTEELIFKRYPDNKEKQNQLMKKLGTFASNTYTLFPPEEDHGVKSNPRSDSCNIKKDARGTNFTPRLNNHRGKNPPRKNYTTKKNQSFNKNQSFKEDLNNNKKNKKRAHEKSKKLSTTDIHPEVIEMFKMAFGSFPNQLQISELESYGMSDELLHAVIKWAGRGGHTPNFMFNQLDKLKENGVKSAQDFVESKSDRKSEWDKLDFDKELDDAWDKSSPIPDNQSNKYEEKFELIPDLQRQYQSTKSNAKSIWKDTLKYIRLKLSSQSYNTWFDNIEVINLQDNTLSIKVDNDFIEDWITSRYYNLISSCLYTLTGTKLNLNIVVRE